MAGSSCCAAVRSASCPSSPASTAPPPRTSLPTSRRYARDRDERVVAALREHGVEPRRTPGNFIADIGRLKPYAVFSPFWRAWSEPPRREIHGAPRRIPTPSNLRVGEMPHARSEVSPVVAAGEKAGRRRMLAWRHKDNEHDRLDRDTSLNNNGNWQWIASVGVDPAPMYRRLYNPTLQQQRHDPDGAYVRRWCGDDYDLEPIVDHAVERQIALAAYSRARGS